jgi:class 3 adenylate cyclase
VSGRLAPVPPPEGARLLEIARELERTGWAFELVDADWRMVWFSEQLKLALDEQDDERLGLGMHVLETRHLPAWQGTITDESECSWAATHAPFIVSADADAIRFVKSEHRRELGAVRAADPPGLWTFGVDWLQPDGTTTRVNGVGLALREGGRTLGYAVLYGPSLPASLLALVVRGDAALWQRMARLIEPRRTAAAILFADLEASTALSRRLPSRAYFDFIVRMTTAIDAEVVSRRGLVGKHAGDGVTAFFLAEDLGSASAAAEAAVQAGRAVSAAARAAGGDIPARLNVGLHWGGGLFMGQLVTGGRLEVTALGDEVNECARIQQSARGGAILGSKALLECLDDEAAARSALDLGRLRYRPLAEVEGAGERAARDAGSIPVADLAG